MAERHQDALNASALQGGFTGAPSRMTIVGWVLFDPACQPFFTLVTTFVFASYFAHVVVGDGARGQALWGYAAGGAGLLVGVLSPFLGALADASGRYRSGMAACGLMLVGGSAALWLAVPGAPAAVPLALIAFMVALFGAECALMFANALMPALAAPHRLGRLSGLGWAAGYLGGLTALGIVLSFLVADPTTGRTALGLQPLFGSDAHAGSGPRIVGPFCAAWFMLFAAPLFLCPCERSRRLPPPQPLGTVIARLRGSVRWIRRDAELLRFMVARMLYADGLAALFTLGGIYAAGTFGWGPAQTGIFGALILVAGIFGALAGGVLNDRIGAHGVILGSIGALLCALLGMLSLERDALLFGLVQMQPSAGDFKSPQERIFLALGLVVGVGAGPLQSSSRVLLVQMAPAGHMGAHFGLFSLSGRVTSFMGPTLAALLTALTASQKAGMTVPILLIAAGGWLLRRRDESGRGGARA